MVEPIPAKFSQRQDDLLMTARMLLHAAVVLCCPLQGQTIIGEEEAPEIRADYFVIMVVGRFSANSINTLPGIAGIRGIVSKSHSLCLL